MSSKRTKLSLITALMACAVSIPAMAGDSKAGGALFQERCAVCHGADGNAKLPGAPSFAKGERMEKSDETLKHTVFNGLNAMPPFKTMLNDAQVADLLAFVRTLKK